MSNKPVIALVIVVLIGLGLYSASKRGLIQTPYSSKSNNNSKSAVKSPTPQNTGNKYSTTEIPLNNINFSEGNINFTLNIVLLYSAPDNSGNQYHTVANIPLTNGYSASIKDNENVVIIGATAENLGTNEVKLRNEGNKQNVRLLVNGRYIAPWLSPIENIANNDSRNTYYAFDQVNKTARKIQLVYGGTTENPEGILEIDFDANRVEKIK